VRSVVLFEVPKANLLQATNPAALFESAGVLDQPFIPAIEDVLERLLTTVSNEGTLALSYFDLFVHGLTNICRSIYYGMDLVCNTVEFNLDVQGANSEWVWEVQSRSLLSASSNFCWRRILLRSTTRTASSIGVDRKM